jgi:competence protein ComEC
MPFLYKNCRRFLFWVAMVLIFSIPIFLRVKYLSFHEENIKNSFSYAVHSAHMFSGIIDSEPVIQGSSQSFTVHILNDSGVSTEVLVSEKIYPSYFYGDKIALTGKLFLPRNFSDFDYIHYLSKDGVYFLLKNPGVTVIAHDKGNFVVAFLFKIKLAFLSNLNRVLGEPYSALAGGLVVGEKSSLGKGLIDDFRRAGLIHIVVLSGYNITIVADSIRKVLSFLPRTVGLVSGGSSIILFGILVGGGATVVRSCIMALIAILAQLIYRDYTVSRALTLAAYLMVIQNPYIVLYDPSFQLSFLSTLGLILFASPIERRLASLPYPLHFFFPKKWGIRSLVASTLATQITVLPLLLHMMGQISLVGIFVNILVLPCIPVTMLFVSLTGFLGFVSYYVSLGCAVCAHLLLSYELFMVGFFAHLPYAVATLHSFSLWMMWTMYALYALIFSTLRFKQWLVQNSSLSPPS